MTKFFANLHDAENYLMVTASSNVLLALAAVPDRAELRLHVDR